MSLLFALFFVAAFAAILATLQLLADHLERARQEARRKELEARIARRFDAKIAEARAILRAHRSA